MVLTLQPDAQAEAPRTASGERHQAFAFDGVKALRELARTVDAAGPDVEAALAWEARRVIERASEPTVRVLGDLRVASGWLTEGQDRRVGRLLLVLLAEQFEPIPGLGGDEAHSGRVLERLALRSAAAGSTLRRLVRGDPLRALPAALRRPDLEPLFDDAHDLGGVLVAPEPAMLALSLSRMEDLFRGSTTAEAGAFADWAPTRTPQLLARAKARAFADARQMLNAAGGRSLFLRFEP
ncbi:MAG: hypothetical protein EKK53_11610 [Burkholderiales bacterium]|nr:MAG: hypothetical protein EKK53_11610 [Burkholderiales bacterium]